MQRSAARSPWISDKKNPAPRRVREEGFYNYCSLNSIPIHAKNLNIFVVKLQYRCYVFYRNLCVTMFKMRWTCFLAHPQGRAVIFSQFQGPRTTLRYVCAPG
jgi:hypothetical protein